MTFIQSHPFHPTTSRSQTSSTFISPLSPPYSPIITPSYSSHRPPTMTVKPRYFTKNEVEQILLPATPRPVPQSIREANAIVVGGGPVGLLVAATLLHRGVKVTIIDKEMDVTKYDITRTYSMKLNWRARKAMASIPGLIDRVNSRSVKVKRIQFLYCTAETTKNIKFKSRDPIDGLADLRIFRPSLVAELQQFSAGHENLTEIPGSTVHGVEFQADGQVRLLVKGPTGEEKEIMSNLVFACDGKNSVLGQGIDKWIEESKEKWVKVSRGSGKNVYGSPAVCMCLQALRLNRDVMKAFDDVMDSEEDAEYIRVFGGSRKGR